MNKFRKVWSNVFGVSSSEYSGFRGLVYVSIICAIGLALVNYLTKTPYSNYKNDVRVLDSLLLVMGDVETEKNVFIKPEKLNPFDPNKASKEVLEGVGFPTWLAKRLIKYRATGARFNKPDDLMKLYGFPDSLYIQLVDYVVIVPLSNDNDNIFPARNTEHGSKKVIKKVKVEMPIFDLNTADTAIFQTINGIGSKLSNRIIAYRKALGGFVSKNQLYQVYGLDSVVIDKIVNSSEIVIGFEATKINVNKANKERLASHPYIDWNQAKLIIAYRNQHGSYLDEHHLMKVYSINENWLKKVAPYLTF